MSIIGAAAGQAITASTRFTDENGNAVINIQLPVTFKIFDPFMRLVYSNTAVQDSVDPALFTATFTLPASCPPTDPGENYRLQWHAKTTSRFVLTETEQFALTNPGNEPDDLYPKDVTIIPSQPWMDQFKINYTATPPNVSYKVYDEHGTLITSQTPGEPVKVGNFLIYTVTFPNSLPPPTGVQQHYMGNWIAVDPNNTYPPQIESHPIYVLTATLQTICHAVYRMLSGGILQNVGPFLTWTAGEIAHHSIKGFEVVNGMPPRTSPFSITYGLPVGLTQYIEKAAMVSALREQQFAYMNDWDFQGLGVQLNVNRSAIADLISQLSADLEKGPDAKRNWYASGAPVGTVANAFKPRPLSASQIVLGPATNFVAPNLGFEARVSSYLALGARGITGSNRRL
jgi:hypothetical protein